MKPSPPTIARIAPVFESSDTIAASMPCVLSGSWLRASSAACLQVRVERGVDAQAAAVQPVVALLVRVAEHVAAVEQVVAQRLGEVRAHVRPLRPASALARAARRCRSPASQSACGQRTLRRRSRSSTWVEPARLRSGCVDRVEARRRAHQPGQEGRLDRTSARRRSCRSTSRPRPGCRRRCCRRTRC